MNRKSVILYFYLLLSLSAGFIVGVYSPAEGAEPVERIVAVVGDDPILSSELAAQIQLLAIQRGVRPKNEQEMRELQEQILNDLIAERLMLIEAQKDTMVRVTDEQIEQGVEEHIRSLINQFSSEDAFLNELEKEGMTLRAYKKKLHPEIKNQMMKQQLINMKLADISISNQEVHEFYENYKDSIPDQPEAVKLAHILITFQPSGSTEDSVKKTAETVRQNAVAGADFATLAATYSDGPGALSGGDLGYLSRSDVVPEFGRAAFNLAIGDISGVIRTVYGYHIIKCEDRKEDKGHFRQILFEVLPTAADSALSYKLIDSILTEIRDSADFRELAKIYSADDESRKQGGELGWFAIADLPTEFREGVKKFKEIDDVYGPVRSEYGLHIIKLLDRQEARKITIEDDFDRIKEMARQSKTGDYVDQWVEEMKEDVYVEIRPAEF